MSVAARPGASPRRKPASAKSRPTDTARRPRPKGRPPARAVVLVVGGALWAVLLAAVLVESSFLTALVLIPMAVLATATGVRAAEPKRRSRGRPAGPSGRGRSRASAQKFSPVLAAGVAASVIDPLAALGGPIPASAALVLSFGIVGRLVLPAGFESTVRPLRSVAGRLNAALAPTLAITSIVIARHQSSTLALALVAALMLYDAGACLMGHGRTAVGGPIGVAFGAASVVVVAIFAAAVLNPPFGGNRPWVVFALVAGLAPVGVKLGQMAVGDDRLPAVRRLDSWALAAPAWVLATALLLHR
jgi:hypothetical protein